MLLLTITLLGRGVTGVGGVLVLGFGYALFAFLARPFVAKHPDLLRPIFLQCAAGLLFGCFGLLGLGPPWLFWTVEGIVAALCCHASWRVLSLREHLDFNVVFIPPGLAIAPLFMAG